MVSASGVRAKRLWAVVGAITLIGVAVLVALLWPLLRPYKPRLLKDPPAGTPGVTFAGSFPRDARPLANPRGIAWDGRRLYVAEASSGQLQRFTAEGVTEPAIPLPPTPSGALAYPVDVAPFGSRMAVVDTAGRRVLLVPVSGGKAEVMTARKGDPPLRQPTAVASGGSELFVADAGDHSIKVYDAGGKLRTRLGLKLEPRLTYVTGLALFGDELYVCDTNAGRVLVLDSRTGSQLRVLQQRFELPRDVAVSPAGYVFVADTFSRSVAILTGRGETIDEIGPDGKSPGAGSLQDEIAKPEGVVWIDSQSRLFVTDAEYGDVRAFNVRRP